jgi:DNA polymerase-3 subunit delta'
MRYPWTQTQWQSLVERVAAASMPHGLILHGLYGLGKQAFAEDFAQFLLCDQPQAGQACQQCRACLQFKANTHPDYRKLEPEEAGKSIKIDQVRELVGQLSLASHHGRYRVAIISPAEALNPAAANSLLKSLEEPPPQTVLILVTSRLSALLPTIRSRCQHILFQRPPPDLAQDWLINSQHIAPNQVHASLAMVHGAPLAAMAILESEEIGLREQTFASFCAIANGSAMALPIQPAWLKAPLATPITWMYSWVSDIIKLRCQQSATLTNQDKVDDLQKLAQKVELPKILVFLDSIASLLRMQRVALNPQMTMEQLLVHWQTITSGSILRGVTGVNQ